MPDPIPSEPVPDSSTTQEQLESNIDAELSLKTTTPTPPAAPGEEPTEEPVTPEATPDAPVDDEPEEEPVEEPVEPAKPAEPATPSDEDLFIEVEDAEGVTHKISVIEDLPEDFNPKNNRQALEILSQLAKLDTERETRAVEAAEKEQTLATQIAQQEQFRAWDAEVAELTKAGRLDKVTLDPKDSKYGDDPTVKKANDVFGYMNKINADRTKAGNPNLITSFEDALDKYEANETKLAAEEAKKNGNDLAKQKSALIGGNSSSASGDHYVYRAGSARSMDDLPV